MQLNAEPRLQGRGSAFAGKAYLRQGFFAVDFCPRAHFGAIGVTLREAADAAPVPTALVAVTLNV
jgi:hypothetical protein